MRLTSCHVHWEPNNSRFFILHINRIFLVYAWRLCISGHRTHNRRVHRPTYTLRRTHTYSGGVEKIQKQKSVVNSHLASTTHCHTNTSVAFTTHTPYTCLSKGFSFYTQNTRTLFDMSFSVVQATIKHNEQRFVRLFGALCTCLRMYVAQRERERLLMQQQQHQHQRELLCV